MIIWFSARDIQHITTEQDAKTAIAALGGVITTLMGAAAAAALNGNIKEYSIDTGMTKTRMEYKDVSAITASINALLALQQVYLQMPGMNSRTIRLIDSKNFPRFGYPQ